MFDVHACTGNAITSMGTAAVRDVILTVLAEACMPAITRLCRHGVLPVKVV